ncbi:MAG: pilus assembly protein [Actinomycetota bacterium]|nr:pilus assembly protein [Actinomycetota bacterium]
MNARGSAPVETVLSIVFLMILVLGTIEVALALYGRDVVAAAAHEGARSALELGRDPADASAVAQRTVRQASGRLVRDLVVTVQTRPAGNVSYVQVRVAGWLRPLGPVPVPVPVSAVATVVKEVRPR